MDSSHQPLMREERVLSEGGMGVISLLSFQGQEWVRKRIRPMLTDDPDFRLRFAAEMAAHERCTGHPAIPLYLGEGEEGDQQYLDMEYIPRGIELNLQMEKDIAKQTFHDSFDRNWSYLQRVASAVHYCHERGIIHRDVTLRNIVIADTGNAYLLDFGVAWFSDEQFRQLFPCTDDMWVGVARYRAPELWDFQYPTPQTDIFSFGVVAYHLLTKKAPFGPANDNVVHQQIMASHPPEPRSLYPAIPDIFQNVILRCLEKDPAARYKSMGEVVQDLEKAAREIHQ